MISTNTFDPYNDSFCIAPWTILEISAHGEVYPCCSSIYTYGDITKKSLLDIWNDNPIKEFRKSMLEGVKHPACENCYRYEESGNESHRNYFNQKFFEKYKSQLYKTTNYDGSVSEPNFIEWHVRLSNKCNFKCRTCSLEYSSSIELEKTGKVSGFYDTSDKTYEEVEPYLSNMEELCFVGGEPLILDQHYKILDKLVELGINDKITLSYCTNFSTLTHKQKHVFDFWENFTNKVRIFVSVDGTEKRGELIRNGFNWQKFLYNVNQFNERFGNRSDTYELIIQPTFQALNVFDIVDLHKILYTNKLMQSIDSFLVNFLYTPREMSVWILDKKTKEDAINYIKKYIDDFLIPNKALPSTINQFETMINYINLFQEQLLILDFLKKIKEFDSLRNENTIKTFPEFHRIWKIHDKIMY